MDTAMQIQHVSVTIDQHPILREITLPVRKHAITAVIGMSGCGKTTLLRTMNRSIEGRGVDVQGKIMVDDMDIFSLHTEIVRKKIGLIFQKPIPFPFSIKKNITYALTYHGITKREEQENIVKSCLQKAGLYNEVAGRLETDARLLSGGQQQRLCIARALAVQPEVLLLDEPCSSLDIKNILHIEESLRDIKKTCTIVIVTHNLSQAKRIADDVVYMEKGRVVEYNTTSMIFNQPQKEETRAYLQFIQ